MKPQEVAYQAWRNAMSQAPRQRPMTRVPPQRMGITISNTQRSDHERALDIAERMRPVTVTRQMPVNFWYAFMGACWSIVMMFFLTIWVVSGPGPSLAAWAVFGGPFGIGAGLTVIWLDKLRNRR